MNVDSRMIHRSAAHSSDQSARRRHVKSLSFEVVIGLKEFGLLPTKAVKAESAAPHFQSNNGWTFPKVLQYLIRQAQ